MHMPDILPGVVLAHHTIIHDQFQSTHMHQYLFTCNPGLGCFCIQVVLQIHFPSILRENQKINTDFLHPTHLVKNQEIFSKDVSELLYLIGEKWLNSLSRYGRRVLVTLFHYQKKYEEQHPAFPRNCTETFGAGGWGGVGFKQTAEICTAHSRLHSFSYLCSTKPPLPKRFPLPPKPLWIKKNSGKCFGHQQLKRCSSSRRNRDLLDSKEALMHCTVLNMAHLHCPKCTKGSGPIGSATQKRQLGAAKWQHMQA